MYRQYQFLILSALVSVFASALLISPSMAQDTDDKIRSELGIRQRQVEQQMTELEAKIAVVMEKMRANGEKEQADRLQRALNESKKRLIVDEMAKVAILVDENKFEEANQVISQVIDNLDELVRLLLNEDRDEMSRQKEIDALNRWKQQIEQIKKEQQQQTNESRKVANKDETLKNLDDKIKAVDELIKKQQDVIEKTEQNKKGGITALDRVANSQFGVRKETEDLANQIAKEGQGESGEPKNGDPKNSDANNNSNSGDPKNSDPKNSDPKNSDPKNSDPKNSDPKNFRPQEFRPQKFRPQKFRPQKFRPQNSDPKIQILRTPTQRIVIPRIRIQKTVIQIVTAIPTPIAIRIQTVIPIQIQTATNRTRTSPNSLVNNLWKMPAQQQQQAEQKLSEGKPTDAKRAEERALEDLNKAREELDRERKRIASMKPEEFQRMAAKQRRTRHKTDDVAQEMKKSPKSSDANNQNANNNQQQNQPGQKAVERASQNMQNASQGLEDQDPQKAERQQKQAERELDKALEEIEERLNQLREETREEKLARLEARFREMLARQQVISLTTVELDDKKRNLGSLRRRDELTLLRLAMEEMEIRELGQQAYDLLVEDGTSIVFPEIVQDLREDLSTVAGQLEKGRTDQLTQLIQLEIESTLQELLDALKQAKSKRDGGGGGGGGGGGEPPLLRKSAELKMLRAAQMRVNRRTKLIDRIRIDDGGDADTAAEIQKTAERQAEIVEMAERVMEKQ